MPFPIAIPALMASAFLLTGQPAPTVPDRSAVGPFISPSIDIRGGHTAAQPSGPAGIWIGNPTISRSTTLHQAPPIAVLPACSPGSAPCDFETSFPHQGGNE